MRSWWFVRRVVCGSGSPPLLAAMMDDGGGGCRWLGEGKWGKVWESSDSESCGFRVNHM